MKGEWDILLVMRGSIDHIGSIEISGVYVFLNTKKIIKVLKEKYNIKQYFALSHDKTFLEVLYNPLSGEVFQVYLHEEVPNGIKKYDFNGALKSSLEKRFITK